MGAAYVVEWLKLRRSVVPRVTAVVLVVVPAVMAALFLAMAGSDRGGVMGLKAQALVTGDGWTGYLEALTQIYASAGLLGMGVVVAWCFGREYADRTVGSLFASATPREAVATAKLVVLTAWSTAVSLALIPSALLVGLVAGLGLPDGDEVTGVVRVAGLSVLTGLSALTVALFASVGHGYLPAFGGLIGLVAAAQIAVIAGAGGWFPYAVPGLWAVASTVVAGGSVPAWHLVLVPSTAVLVGGLTVTWWRQAELA